jgi:uncharacterized SAM-binding protein YcdF (DUF218 family)
MLFQMENTADEAVAAKELISPNKNIILVTSAYHMYRAKRLFEDKKKTAGESSITIMDFLPSAGGLELTETGVREILGRLFYLIQ